LRFLFDYLNTAAIQLRFAPTPRNGPLQIFLRSISDDPLGYNCTVTRRDFDLRCPAMYHNVVAEIPAKASPAS